MVFFQLRLFLKRKLNERYYFEWRIYHFHIILLRTIQNLKMSVAGILVFGLKKSKLFFELLQIASYFENALYILFFPSYLRQKCLAKYNIKARVLKSYIICVTIIRLMTTHYRLPLKRKSSNSPEYWAAFMYCKTIICYEGLACPLCFAYPCPTIATAVIRGLKLVIHER